MKLTILLLLSLLYCIGHVHAQKTSSEKEKNNVQKPTRGDTLPHVSSQISVNQNGGNNTVMIGQSGSEKENLITTNYTEVYENGTNKIVISTYQEPDSMRSQNPDGSSHLRMNSRATVIQRGRGNSVSISQSPIR